MSNYRVSNSLQASFAKITYLLVILSLLIPNGAGLTQTTVITPSGSISVTVTPQAATQSAQPTGTSAPTLPISTIITTTIQSTASSTTVLTITPTSALSPTLTATSIVSPTVAATAVLSSPTAIPTLIPTTALPTTATPLPTATFTPFPTAQPTLTATPTSSSTPSITSSPAITSSNPITPGLISLILSALPMPTTAATTREPEGDLITITWELTATQLNTNGLELDIVIPDGFKPGPSDQGSFDPGSNTVRVLNPAKRGSLTFVIGPLAFLPAFLQAFLLNGVQTVSQASLELNPTWSEDVTQSGGKVDAFSGRVKIDFPPDALSEDMHVVVRTPDKDKKVPYFLGGFPFEVIAKGKSDQREIHKFKSPFTIEVGYDVNTLRGPESALKLNYFDEVENDWIPISTLVVTQTHTLVAQVDHLTLFDYDAEDWEAGRLPGLKDFQVAQFTGAATYNFPIQVPAEPGGLQPSLSLSYNSQIADNAGSRSQASWVGMGWSLDVGYIRRSQKGSPDSSSDDTFDLNVYGQGGMLLPGGDSYYHTSDENFWRIARYNAESSNDYWVVWDKAGNQYTFTSVGVYSEIWPGHIPDYRLRTWYWGLTSIRDIYGQTIQITYNTETKDYKTGGGYYTVITIAAYPATITYPNQRYQIQFELDSSGSRSDYETKWTKLQSTVLYMTKRLKNIKIMNASTTPGNYDQIIREYDLAYADGVNQTVIFPYNIWPAGGKTPTLYSITEYGLNRAVPLPATTFTYDGLHLSSANNGYGGQVAFTYTPWYETQSSTKLMCNGMGHSWVINGAIAPGEYFPYTSCINQLLYNSGYFQPGGAYNIYTYAFYVGAPGTMQLGFDDGSPNWGSTFNLSSSGAPYTSTLIMVNTSSKFRPMLTCTTCYITEYDVTPLQTYYRVATKTTTDQFTGKSFTDTYNYDEPATNDNGHSFLAASGGHHYIDKYSEFRGHAMVKETGPDGKVTKTYYYQDDNFKGKPAVNVIGTEAFSDQFDTLNTTAWTPRSGPIQPDKIAGDNAIKIYNPNPTWSVYLYRTPQNIQNTGSSANTMLAQFRLSGAATKTLLALQDDTYPYPSSRWARWGITVDGTAGTIKTHYYLSNSDGPYETVPLLTGLQLDHWYVLQLSADNHQMLTRVWDRDNPSIKGEYACSTNSGGSCNALANRSWRFYEWTSSGTTWLDDYSEGLVYNQDTFYYTKQLIYTVSAQQLYEILPGGAHDPYMDLQINWNSLTQDIHQSFERTATWSGTERFYHYDSSDQGGVQYGNLTRIVESYWDGSSWIDYRNTLTRYYPPANGSPYLVGLPGYTNQYSCPTNSQNGSCYSTTGADYVLSSHWYLYDGSMLYSTQPSVGKLTGERDFVCYADSNNVCYSGYVSGSRNKYIDVKYEYDAYGNRTSDKKYSAYGWWQGANNYIWQGNELATTRTYDSNYHTYPVSQLDPASLPTTWVYTYTFGLPTSETLPNGSVTTASYDKFGRLLTIFKPGDDSLRPTNGFGYFDGYLSQYSAPFMTDNQNRIDGVDPYNNYRKFYDGFGNLIQTQTARSDVNGANMDVVVDYGYDAYGRTITQTVPYSITAWYTGYSSTPYRGQNHDPSKWTTSSYDILGRPLVITAPDRTTTSYSYYITGTKVTDAAGHITQNLIDGRGRTIQVIPAAGPAVSYTYNDLDQLIQTEKSGAITSMTYDNAGRKTSLNDPDMGAWTYTYDSLGGIKTQTDARGCITTMSYDNLERLTGKTFSGTCSTTSITYSYDAFNSDTGQYDKGYRTGMTDGSGSTTWRYDLRGRMTYESKSVTGIGTFLTRWGYDSADRVSWMQYPGGNAGQSGEQVSYAYNHQLTLSSVYSSAIVYAQNTYDAAGRVVSRTLGGGAVNTSYTFYPFDQQGGRLQTLVSTPNLQSLSYTYDAVGNVKTILDGQNSNQKQCFRYDTANRLTKGTTYTDGEYGCMTQLGTGNYDENYTYHPDTGNLYTKTGLGTYIYDSVHKHAVASVTGMSFQYDANGNMTQRTINGTPNQVYNLSYDAENRMTGVSGQTTAGYVYDGDGNRVKATTGGTTTVYIGNYYEETTSTSSTLNFAQGKPASQMSTYNTACNPVAGKAVDGNTDGNFANCSVTHTNSNSEPQPWWQVDLGAVQSIDTIAVWNRTDCCSDRLSNFYVFVSDNPFTSYDINTTINQAGVTNYYFASAGTNPLNINVKRTGRYIRVQLASLNYLSLAEVQVLGKITKSYYYSGSQRIAMRVQGDPVPANNGLFYLLGDHLGSTSITTDASGNRFGELRYKPWGENRYTSGTTPTTFKYTGQRQGSYITDGSASQELYWMGSRYYDPALGRFIQPDSLIPEAYNPLAYDRYQYVYSNPVRFNDSSGHCIDGISTWVCLAVAGAAIGAASGYVGQVINNLNNGYNLGEAATTNISAEPIVTGAVLGFTAVVAAPAVIAGAGDILVGAGVATSSTALFGAGIGAYETATTIEHFYSYGTTLPVLEFDSKQFPNIAPHIQDAQKAGQPSVLTRTTNSMLMSNNRAAATGGVSGLDEYPFASTYEGGAGASVRNVPAAENRLQGLRIANFYWRNKIGDGDKFMVKGR